MLNILWEKMLNIHEKILKTSMFNILEKNVKNLGKKYKLHKKYIKNSLKNSLLNIFFKKSFK